MLYVLLYEPARNARDARTLMERNSYRSSPQAALQRLARLLRSEQREHAVRLPTVVDL